MRKLLLLCALLAVFAAGCACGPNHLSRTVDDWQNVKYEENPALVWALTDVIPAIPFVKFVAAVPDVLVLNPVQFWGYDVWASHGVGFTHKQPQGDKEVWFKSVMAE